MGKNTSKKEKQMEQCSYCDGHNVVKDWQHLYYPNGKIYHTWCDIIPCPICEEHKKLASTA